MTALAPGDARAFRNALGTFATGVTIVTARATDGRDTGLTANSFNSVSLEPPMVLWSLARASRSLPVFEEASHFAVHVLASDQQALSDRFARRGEDKFADLSFSRGKGDAVLLDGCSARFECRTVFRYEGGDHVIFVGEVETFDAGEKPPLIYHGGKYGLLVRRPVVLPDSIDGNAAHRDLLTYLLSVSFHQTFLPVRHAFGRHALTEDEYFTLTALANTDHRASADVRALLAAGGRDASGMPEDALLRKGLIALDQLDDGSILRLTETGRALVIEFAAINKETETTMLEGLGESEILLLRQLLRRIIRISSPGGPSAWKRGT